VIKKHASFKITNSGQIKLQMLSWANRFNICTFLDNHHYPSTYNSFECLLAAGTCNIFTQPQPSLQDLKQFIQHSNDWLFGHVNYDFIQPYTHSSTFHPDGVKFPDIFFYQPEIIIRVAANQLHIESCSIDPEKIWEDIQAEKIVSSIPVPVQMQPVFSKKDYICTIQQLQQHILRGDCYEINFCQEFYAADIVIDPVHLYHRLSVLSPVPFGCFYKLEDKYLLCASPERYVKKQANTLIAQPIKGTRKRNLSSASADAQLKADLLADLKERAENVMIVDLVRNDLSKICTEGSVKVEELFGIYSFPQVHQMISTISGNLPYSMDFVDVLDASFPMGSMTGAPKKRVMQLIDQYEQSKRGIFSGTVGYITPEKDFDFNVVIRSLMYNQTNQYLSYQVGSAITAKSDPEKEYEECLLKANAIRQVLE